MTRVPIRAPHSLAIFATEQNVKYVSNEVYLSKKKKRKRKGLGEWVYVSTTYNIHILHYWIYSSYHEIGTLHSNGANGYIAKYYIHRIVLYAICYENIEESSVRLNFASIYNNKHTQYNRTSCKIFSLLFSIFINNFPLVRSFSVLFSVSIACFFPFVLDNFVYWMEGKSHLSVHNIEPSFFPIH